MTFLRLFSSENSAVLKIRNFAEAFNDLKEAFRLKAFYNQIMKILHSIFGVWFFHDLHKGSRLQGLNKDRVQSPG